AHESTGAEGDLDLDTELAVGRERALRRGSRVGGLRVEVEVRGLRADGVSGDRDPGDHVGRAATEERPRERAAGVRVVPVRDDERLAARRVAADRAQLLDEREAGPSAAPKATALDDREKLLELERSRTRQRSGGCAVEEPWRGAS